MVMGWTPKDKRIPFFVVQSEMANEGMAISDVAEFNRGVVEAENGLGFVRESNGEVHFKRVAR